MIKKLALIIRRLSDCGLDLKDSDDLSHDWSILILKLKLSYRTSIHAATEEKPEIIEKVCNTKNKIEILSKDLVDIITPTSVFRLILDKLRLHSLKIMNKSSDISK
ncbi:hypothetical protein O181_067876 [Austropuccinia psidii MF-1]|uniref:Uncharacterized protein n=1 Tax=Austropuccinia psidii MF-1 TaxID=1389203 RepID=A0A9Q3I3G6_9BASI|nr:hypothetical protein [Austropuccinia psidii MF-1]